MPTSDPSAAAGTDPIEVFARGRLGCSCEPDVFRRIAVEAPGGGSCRIDIGGRLLIELVADRDVAADPDRVRQLLEAGQAERDRRGMNRYRLVLAEYGAAAATLAATPPDDRTHLHRLPLTEIQALLDLCRERAGSGSHS